MSTNLTVRRVLALALSLSAPAFATENGRITDNWHIEDNLTLLQEMGVAKINS